MEGTVKNRRVVLGRGAAKESNGSQSLCGSFELGLDGGLQQSQGSRERDQAPVTWSQPLQLEQPDKSRSPRDKVLILL